MSRFLGAVDPAILDPGLMDLNENKFTCDGGCRGSGKAIALLDLERFFENRIENVKSRSGCAFVSQDTLGSSRSFDRSQRYQK